MIGETLATRYRLEAELGRGGMGTVYRAVDLRLSRPVAVKVMHPTLSEKDRARFLREAELVASVKHPNVLEVHDAGEERAIPYLVTELVEGANLRRWAEAHAPLPPSVCAVLAMEVARALSAAHARGIVHRDVKPENVLVQTAGALKLADFGIAAAAEQDRLTTTGSISGSLPYMAPERIDTGAFSPASDVYAVGVLLFELCAGRTPFAGKGAAHLAAAALTREAPVLAELDPAVPGEVSTVVARCLRRDPEERFKDGAQLLQALETCVRALVGPPADSARRLSAVPEELVAEERQRQVERLLKEGKAALAKGDGARAARLLDAAARVDPKAAQVAAVLGGRRASGGRRTLWAGLVVAVGLSVAAAAVLMRRDGAVAGEPAGDSRTGGSEGVATAVGSAGGPATRGSGRADDTASGESKTGGLGEARASGDDAGDSKNGSTAALAGDSAHSAADSKTGSTAALAGDSARTSADSKSGSTAALAGDSARTAADSKTSSRSGGALASDSARTAADSKTGSRSGGALAGDSARTAADSKTGSRSGGALAGDSARTAADSKTGSRSGGALAGDSARTAADSKTGSRSGGALAGDSARTAADSKTGSRSGGALAGDSARTAARGGDSKTAGAGDAQAGDSTRAGADPVPSPSPTDSTSSASRLSDAAAPATLRLSTRPWAEVFVDGVSAGYTPKLKTLQLSPGQHTVRLVNPLCEPFEAQLSVASGEVVKRDWALKVREGQLRIAAPSGALLFIDGVHVGAAPLPSPLPLSHGDHTVEAKLPGGGTVKRSVRIVAGETASVTLEAAR